MIPRRRRCNTIYKWNEILIDFSVAHPAGSWAWVALFSFWLWCKQDSLVLLWEMTLCQWMPFKVLLTANYITVCLTDPWCNIIWLLGFAFCPSSVTLSQTSTHTCTHTSNSQSFLPYLHLLENKYVISVLNEHWMGEKVKMCDVCVYTDIAFAIGMEPCRHTREIHSYRCGIY